MFKTITVIQARLGSSRLPRKVLLPLGGKPMLLRMIERVKMSKLAGKIIIATTLNKEDDEIVGLCNANELNVFRGDQRDLLDRHYKCAIEENAKIILKIPSDCPLIDPNVIDKVVDYFLQNKVDYCSNLHPQSYPDGQDVEVFSISSLKKAWEEAKLDFEREHTTPYIWERPNLFKIKNYKWEEESNLSMTYRITVDYKEDYELVKRVFDKLYKKNRIFTIREIVSLLKSNKDIYKLNLRYVGVNWYRNHLDELKTIKQDETRFI